MEVVECELLPSKLEMILYFLEVKGEVVCSPECLVGTSRNHFHCSAGEVVEDIGGAPLVEEFEFGRECR